MSEPNLESLSFQELNRLSIATGCPTPLNDAASTELKRRGYVFDAPNQLWTLDLEHIKKFRDGHPYAARAVITQLITEVEHLRAEHTRTVLRYTAKGYAAGENADSKHWRLRAEAAEAALVDARHDAHGEGQEHTIADVNAGRIDDLIAPRLRRERIDLAVLAKCIRMLGLLPHEHPHAAVYNEALKMASAYISSFIGREEFLPRGEKVK